MKFAMMVFIAQAFLLFMKGNPKAQALEIVEGTVQIIYVKDTSWGNHIYLESKREFNGHYFEDVADIIPLIDLLCGENNIRYPEERMAIFELPQYQSQKKNNNYYRHCGGDVFITPDKKIVITFQIKAEVIKLEKQPCKGIYFQSPYSCPVERAPIEYPVYLIVNVIEANSLSPALLERDKLKPYSKKSFLKDKCD